MEPVTFAVEGVYSEGLEREISTAIPARLFRIGSCALERVSLACDTLSTAPHKKPCSFFGPNGARMMYRCHAKSEACFFDCPIAEERHALEERARSLTSAYRDVIRAKIVLFAADGMSLSAIARRLNRQRDVVRLWVARFSKDRLEGLADKEGRGRKPRFSPCGDSARGETRVRAA